MSSQVSICREEKVTVVSSVFSAVSGMFGVLWKYIVGGGSSSSSVVRESSSHLPGSLPSGSAPTEQAGIHREEMEQLMKSWIVIDSPLISPAVIFKELEEIRSVRSETAMIRRIFQDHAGVVLAGLTGEDRELLLTSQLDSSDRSKIILDATKSESGKWLKALSVLFSQSEADKWTSWCESFQETAYCKGILGEMRSLAWMTSQGTGAGGLGQRLLGEISWTLFSSLAFSLRVSLGREMTPEESRVVQSVVLPVQQTLCQLWTNTEKASRKSRGNEGRLPAVWVEEEKKVKQEKKRKLALGTLPRFEPGKKVIVGPTEKSSLSREEKATFIRRLEYVRGFRVIDNYSP